MAAPDAASSATAQPCVSFVCCCCDERLQELPAGTCAACFALSEDCANSSLCSTCATKHSSKKKKYDGHIVLAAGAADPAAVALAPFGKQPVSAFCTVHLAKKRAYRCGFEACRDALLCEECLPDHLGHRECITKLADVASGLRKALEAELLVLMPSSGPTSAPPSTQNATTAVDYCGTKHTLVDMARGTAARVAAVRRALEDATPAAFDDIARAQDALVSAVIARCDWLRTKLDAAFRVKVAAVQAELDTADQALARSEAAESTVRRALSSDLGDVDVVSHGAAIAAHLQAVHRAVLEQTPVQFAELAWRLDTSAAVAAIHALGNGLALVSGVTECRRLGP
jgi:hypothetical protein